MSENNQLKHELYLFDFCPFAQQVQLNLLHAEIDFEKKILKPGQMPENFSTISPLGNVPVLCVDGKSIFESAVINEYIAAVADIDLLPENAVIAAQMRSWNAYNDSCLSALMQTVKATSKQDFTEALQNLQGKFEILSTIIDAQGPWFYGTQYTLIDSCYTPLFLRIQTLHSLYPEFVIQLPEGIEAWSQQLLSQDLLQEAIIGDFTEVYRRFIARMAKGSYVQVQIDNAATQT